MKLLSSKRELNDALIEIIEKNQEEKLIIISPFINFWDMKQYWLRNRWDNLIELLNKKESILEIYTKYGFVNTIKRHLKINENRIIPIDNLHAKIYINDDTILLSSMNLNFSSFNRSLDFGIIAKKDKSEYNDVIDYCNKNIFIYNPKFIIDDLSKHNIDARFDQNFYLILKKNDKTGITCHISLNDSYPDNIYFYLDIPRKITGDTSSIIKNISEKHGFEIKSSSTTGLLTKRYYFRLEKKEYPVVSLIPIININREKILGILVDIYNRLAE